VEDRFRAVATAALVSSLCASSLGAAEADAERTAWRYRRPVVTPAQGELVALGLPPEVAGRAQPDLRDLRLVGSDGQEVAYVVDRVVAREAVPSWSGSLIDTRREVTGPTDDEHGVSTLVVDLAAPRTFDTIALSIPGQNFAKRVRIETSDDRAAWRLLADDAGVFDGAWGNRVHHTTIALNAPATARFLRLSIADGRASPVVSVTGVVVSAVRRAEGEEWRRPVTLQPVAGPRPTRYRLDTTLNLEALELECDDPAFARAVTLVEVVEREGRRQERALGQAMLYRLRVPEPKLVGEDRVLRLSAPRQGGEVFLEVDDRDSPPLRNPRVVASGAAVRLVFPAPANPPVLYYGNDATRGPLYDLDVLKAQIRFASGLGKATLGEETANPLYRRPEPIPFAALRGQKVETQHWRGQRRLEITGAPDICALTLAPPDVAFARSDFSDLRLVADDGSQVPYLLATGTTGTLALDVETEPTRQTERGALSPYGLRVPGSAAANGQGTPLVALELTVAEPFFERPARVVTPPPAGATAERTAYSGNLSRRAAPARAEGAPFPPLVIPLDGQRVESLTLEVADGDDARLSLVSAAGRVALPRLVFKAAAGSYRLLLGNSEASAPRYDLASLRQEVLSYSARPVQAAGVQQNPEFRRSAREYFRGAPPTALLWGTLVVAVVALLLLTARVLRAPSAPPS
jgi:uncharacterized protein DUF3999/F5/8 type C domain-containing protein